VITRRRWPRACARLASEAGPSAVALAACAKRAAGVGVSPPAAATEAGSLARLQCPTWWRRRLRSREGRDIEEVALAANLVNGRMGAYASDAAVERRHLQKVRNRLLLEELEVVNEIGEAFTLQEFAEHSPANPRVRRAELMVRIAGFELVADRLEHVGEFYTVTCPSRMPASLSRSDEPNPRYDGSTPREAQAYLNTQWQKARAALHRRGISVDGFRVAEP
jgi:hypothetical protein